MGGFEKRRFKRVTITSVAEIMLAGKNEKFRAYVGGISRGGMEIYTPTALSPGNRIQVQIHFIDINGKEMVEEVRGEIKWANQFADAYVAGLEFSEVINGSNFPALLAYLEQAEKFYTV